MGNKIIDNKCGVALFSSINNTLYANILSNNIYGIMLGSSDNNDLLKNTIFGNKYSSGISLNSSHNNTLNGNNLSNNKDGFIVSSSDNNVLMKNEVAGDGRGFGVKITDSKNNSLMRNKLTNNDDSINLYNSENNTIAGNTLSNNKYGIVLGSSDNNDLLENTIFGNKNSSGISMDSSQNNTFEGNNLSNNMNGFIVSSSDNNDILENDVAGDGNGFGVEMTSSENNTVSSNSLSNNRVGVRLYSSHNNYLLENDGIGNDSGPGIELEGSDNNTIIGNNFSNGDYGIHLLSSGYNRLSNNSFFGNKYNFHMEGGRLGYFDNDIDISNLVNGQPIYYLKDKANVTIDFSSNAGLVGCFNCTNIVVRNISISNVGTGIGLYRTTHSIVESSNITNITEGIILYLSNDNKIMSNTIDKGEYGIKIISSNNNSLEDNVIGDSLKKYIGYNALGNNTFSNNSKNEIEDASLFRGLPVLKETVSDSYTNAGYKASISQSKSSEHGKHKMPKTDVKSTIPAQPDDEDLMKLFGGIISFKPKIHMIVNETTDVIASIAPNNTSASKTIYAIKENDADLVVKGFAISKWMRLSLQDPGKKFQIELLSHEDQKILGDVPATWRWAVTPKKEGKHRLILVATLLEEEENGDKEPIRDVDVQTELIDVIANENETIIKPSLPGVSEVGKGISSFIKEIVGLLTAIFGLIVLYRKLKKGEGD